MSPITSAEPDRANEHALQCMEIWGGNWAVDTAVSTPGLDMWIYSAPYEASKTGGDVHYVSLCGSGRISRFAIADVSGHGAAVDALAKSLRKLVRRNINTAKQTSMARALNTEFAKLSDGGAFATAILATYWTPTDQLSISNAGHPRPLWRSAAGGEWTALTSESAEMEGRETRSADLPLGVLSETDYQQFSVTLAPEDLLLFYTDAAIEAKDRSGRQLGEQGFLELMRGLDTLRPSELLPHILGALEAHRGGAEPDDDLTLMLVHHNASNPPKPSLTDVARVTARMLGLQKI